MKSATVSASKSGNYPLTQSDELLQRLEFFLGLPRSSLSPLCVLFELYKYNPELFYALPFSDFGINDRVLNELLPVSKRLRCGFRYHNFDIQGEQSSGTILIKTQGGRCVIAFSGITSIYVKAELEKIRFGRGIGDVEDLQGRMDASLKSYRLCYFVHPDHDPLDF